jgi:hypothetical protein
MAPMSSEWTPADEKAARTFSRYRQARKTEKELKPTVRELAVEELRRGASPAQLAALTGDGAEAFRRLREEHGIAVDPRYESRAELARARKKAAPTVAAAAPQSARPRPASSPAPAPEPDFTDEEIRSFADLAQERATPDQLRRLERTGGTVKAVDRDRAIADEAYKMGLLKDSDFA